MELFLEFYNNGNSRNLSVQFPSAGGRRSFYDSRSLGLANIQSAFSKLSKVHWSGHIISTTSQKSTA